MKKLKKASAKNRIEVGRADTRPIAYRSVHGWAIRHRLLTDTPYANIPQGTTFGCASRVNKHRNRMSDSTWTPAGVQLRTSAISAAFAQRFTLKAAVHHSEEARITALRSYDILDTPREAEFDDIVRVIAEVCEAPISVINLIDNGRQWFKAEVGLGVRETPIDSSFCAHAILQPGLFLVPDTTLDERFCDNPLVLGDPRLRFYAGALLETFDGLPLGTVCVLDYKPRTLDETQKFLLRVMASQVIKTLELRRSIQSERAARLHAEMLVKENEMLAREGDHRVMNSLQLVQSVLSLQSRSAKSEAVKSHLESARNRVMAIATVHRELHLAGSLQNVDIANFLRRICENLGETAPPLITSLDISTESLMVLSDHASSVGLIVAELVTNSFKYAYSDQKRGPVRVSFAAAEAGWRLQVEDDGGTLPPDFDAGKSAGVGMRVVNALVRRLNGHMTVEGDGLRTRFVINFAKL